ncbi:MAG: hypothetical protein WB762_19310 [Candidatus Sulfotelmatobacter sp.]
MTGSTGDAKLRTVTAGIVLLAGGLTINYLLERYNVFKVWENSRYPISWADLFYPPLCVFLSLTGIALGVGGAIYRLPSRVLLRHALKIVIPLTLGYILFAFAMQFVATGADRLGECPGLDQAASSSNVIPESKWRPGHPAVGCAIQRRGMFLSYYNDIGVYGVTDAVAQQLVLDRVAEHFRQAQTHPVQVVFYDMENVSVRQLQNGATLSTGGRSKLIRVVNIG